jgi:hypothetical protein
MYKKMSTLIDAVNFAQINAAKWADDANAEYLTMSRLRAELLAISVLWQRVIDAADAVATTAAVTALKADIHKIVNLSTGVFPSGGSRKRRQSKKRRNQRKHNNQ